MNRVTIIIASELFDQKPGLAPRLKSENARFRPKGGLQDCSIVGFEVRVFWSLLWGNGMERVFLAGVRPDSPSRGDPFLLLPFSTVRSVVLG